MEFKYFRKPNSFAFRTDTPKGCSICGMQGIWFDGSGFNGTKDIECVCEQCLTSGKLKELEIETNIVREYGNEDADEIVFATPSLPTWQDCVWPCIDERFLVFERIASKQDFANKDEFKSAHLPEVDAITDFDFLWDTLPDQQLKNYQEGGDISVYLFSNGDKKYWLWDAN